MKKHLTLLLFATLFMSCSSDDNKDDNKKDILRLTRWEQKIDNTTYAFQFTINNYCNYVRKIENYTPYSEKLKYRINGNELIIMRLLSTSTYATGTLNDDEIRITFDEKDLILKEVPYVKYE